ncbi:MAG: CarD family transcriptional regulator, partial [Myxococcaceae bacterium]|nr:CarD family transcriptional regulator [Myxococcaceae bacterium]
MPDASPVPAAPLPVLNLSVGDRVVYPNQGLCNVTEIATDEIAGQKLVFVTLTFVETGA